MVIFKILYFESLRVILCYVYLKFVSDDKTEEKDLQQVQYDENLNLVCFLEFC